MSEESTESSEVAESSYPRRAKLTLVLEVLIPDAERDSYIFAEPAKMSKEDFSSIPPTLQIGFLADLFDLLNFEASLGVEKINNFTQAQITKTLQGD